MKHLSNLIRLFCMAIFFSLPGHFYAQAQPATGPVAWWSMSGSDSVLVDQAGGHSGILKNYAEGEDTFVEGKVGMALAFHGSNAFGNNNFVSVSDDINWMADGEFTVCFWMYLDTVGSPQKVYPIIVGNYGETNSMILQIYKKDSWWRAFTWDKNFNERRIHRKARAAWTHIFDNKWWYVALVSDSEKLELFIDGESAGAVAGLHEGTSVVRSLSIGGTPDPPRAFKGMLDEIRLYDYALNQDEIKALMSITTSIKLQNEAYKLEHYPNPFSVKTTITYTLPRASTVSLDLLNINGQQIKTLVNEEVQHSGVYRKDWDGRNNNNTMQPDGTYFYRLRIDNKTSGIGKIIRIK